MAGGRINARELDLREEVDVLVPCEEPCKYSLVEEVLEKEEEKDLTGLSSELKEHIAEIKIPDPRDI